MIKVSTAQTNQGELKAMLEQVVLPKKGRLTIKEKERKYADELVQARKQHSAIESAINALEGAWIGHLPPDHGLKGFQRYTAMAVLSRNIQILGTIIRNQKREGLERQQQAA